MKDKRQRIAAVCIILSVLVAAGAITIIFKQNQNKKEQSQEELVYEAPQEDISKHPYVKDVRYTGPVKYMELFDYSFQKSDRYRRNKDFDTESVDTEKAADTAKKFIEELYTVDYRNLAESTGSYKELISKYIDPETGGFFSDTEPIISSEDTLDAFIEDLATYYVENSISSKATFITDPELVYEDIYFFCRGVIEYEKYGGESTETQCIPVEIAMIQQYNTETPYIIGIFPVIDSDTKDEYKPFVMEVDEKQ